LRGRERTGPKTGQPSGEGERLKDSLQTPSYASEKKRKSEEVRMDHGDKEEQRRRSSSKRERDFGIKLAA